MTTPEAIPSGQRARVDWVDVAKGLSIIAVVFFHVSISGFSSPVADAINAPVGAARMPLFFFLSGLFAHRLVAQPWPTVVRRRVVGLLVPFAVWTVLFTVAFPNMSGRSAMVELVDPTGVTWFLAALAIAAILTRATAGLPRGLVLAVALVLPVVAAVVLPELQLKHLVQYWPMFLAGLWLRDAVLAGGVGRILHTHRARTAGIAVASGAVAACCGLAWSVVDAVVVAGPVRDGALWSLSATAKVATAPFGIVGGIVVASALSRLRWAPARRVTDLIRWFGSHSLPTYVTHMFVLLWLRELVVTGIPAMEEAVRQAPLTAACLMTAACLAAGALTEVTVGRMPVLRWVLYPPVPSGTPGVGRAWAPAFPPPARWLVRGGGASRSGSPLAGASGEGHLAHRVPAGTPG